MPAPGAKDLGNALSVREQLQQREAEIRMLLEVNRLVGSEYNLQKVFDQVAKSARNLIDAQTVTIPILSDDQRSYTYRSAVGENADELLGATLPIEVGICGWVLRNHKPWWRGLLEELSEQERNQWEQEAGSIILVPLIGHRRFLGGIAGINKCTASEFDQRDYDLLNMFASQVSIAIENAMFVDELGLAREHAEAYREKLESLNTRLKDTNVDLQRLAVLDPLSGLPNRTLIMDRLEQALREAKRFGHGIALIMIDLDHFKEVNDTLGHSVGDELLIAVGNTLRSGLREPDTLGRLGGDEFAVVVPHANHDTALTVVNKLHSVLQHPLKIGDNNFSVSASMGVALYPEHGDDPSVLLRCADVAMYVAKRNRGEFAVYSSDEDKHNADRLELLHDLRKAIQEQTISVAFQPKLDLRSNLIIGVEALARWTHPVRGVIPPYEFIPVLEHTGLIKPFTLQMLEMALSHCKTCLDKGFRLSVAVNLSMHNLRDDNLPRQVEELLSKYQLEREYLTLEITESAIMHEPERSLDILRALDEMGVYLSIDDFGTGYSSLSYLKRLPVKQLKIDRSFVSDMIVDKDDAMIVRSTIDLAHNLGLSTVAEGVETEQILERLKGMECDVAQGYLISRPLSQDDFISYLESGEWVVPGTD